MHKISRYSILMKVRPLDLSLSLSSMNPFILEPTNPGSRIPIMIVSRYGPKQTTVGRDFKGHSFQMAPPPVTAETHVTGRRRRLWAASIVMDRVSYLVVGA